MKEKPSRKSAPRGSDRIDWARCFGACVGLMGMRPADFWSMSLPELDAALRALRESRGGGAAPGMSVERYRELKAEWEERNDRRQP